MNLVYFSHSYRKEDANIVEYFGKLMRSEGIIPSLDPPSNMLNSAKLERHLKCTDGMVAVLTSREGGISEYILYEIFLCHRSRKPLIVFVEDTLPNHLFPTRILQMRFSRKAFLRQVREHRHGMQMLKSYLGDNPPAIYQPSLQKRTCAIIGSNEFPIELQNSITDTIYQAGYSLLGIDDTWEFSLFDKENLEEIICSDLAICSVDTTNLNNRYLIGMIRALMIPTIMFTTNQNYSFCKGVPIEFQPRIIKNNDVSILNDFILTELRTFEEMFIDLNDQEEIDTYVESLILNSSQQGNYKSDTRNIIIKEIVMRDKYTAGQVGAQGPGAKAQKMSFNQKVNGFSDELDLVRLSNELGILRTKLKEEANDISHDVAIGTIAQAEDAATKGDKKKTIEYLSKAGSWVFDVATKIGTSLAASVIKSSLNL